MSWDKSEVMQEFAKISGEQGLLKNAQSKEDDSDIRENRKDPDEKSIIEEAHPESIYIAESRGDGGLVENQIEQQKKLIEMVNKMPTGNLVGRYATQVNTLVALANMCDELGQEQAADFLTDAAKELLEKSKQIPFDKAPGK
jgi:hypothetical protein